MPTEVSQKNLNKTLLCIRFLAFLSRQLKQNHVYRAGPPAIYKLVLIRSLTFSLSLSVPVSPQQTERIQHPSNRSPATSSSNLLLLLMVHHTTST